MAWRGANSLVTLKNQLDQSYPGWSFLGMLGDQSHAAVASDHNPNASGVVTAMDIGPGGGLDIHALADRLAANPHPDLKYIISNRRIAEWQYGFKWRPYNGSDPHDTHIHVSVGRGADGQSIQPYDDTTPWAIKEQGEDVVKPNAEQVKALFNIFSRDGRSPTQDQINFYTQRDLRDLYQDLLTYEVKPGPDEVKDYFKRYIRQPIKDEQVSYYTERPRAALLADIAQDLKGQVEEAKAAGNDSEAAKKLAEIKSILSK